MKVTLLSKLTIFSDINTFVLKPDQLVTWQAGQYLRYHLKHQLVDERGENRFFTISSAPFEKYIHLTTRITSKSSSFKRKLLSLESGDTLEAFGPNGKFTVEDPYQQMVFIAGGIGITPFYSIIKDLAFRQQPLNITLLYANSSKEIVFQKELEKLSVNHPEFTIQYFIGNHKINKSTIQSLTSNLQSRYFYISGPEEMMKYYLKMLKNIGISDQLIKHDFFPGYDEI